MARPATGHNEAIRSAARSSACQRLTPFTASTSSGRIGGDSAIACSTAFDSRVPRPTPSCRARSFRIVFNLAIRASTSREARPEPFEAPSRAGYPTRPILGSIVYVAKTGE